MTFSEFAELCYRLERTSSRTAKIEATAAYLRRLSSGEIRSGVAFLAARPFPISDSRSLQVGPAAIADAFEAAPAAAGTTAPLELGDVAESFGAIAEAAGKGSRQGKSSRLRDLVARTAERDRPILLRLLRGELRIGLHDGLIQEAIACAAAAPASAVRRAALFLSDLSEVAAVALGHGVGALDQAGIRLFVPLLPMLSELSEDFDAIFRAQGGATALEFKYDGARVQIHKQGEGVRIWSRRLTEVTGSIPEIADIARRDFGRESCIVDGEVVAVGKNLRPLPFQELMRRFKRVHGIAAAAGETPLSLHLFDCLWLDGASLIDEPYERRWAALAALTGDRHLAARKVTSERAEAEGFLKEALASGHEGVMAKALASPYMPGNRGKLWFKVKPAETVDCAIVAADRGSGRRRGWLSNYHLAVAGAGGRFEPVGKTFKGLTDAQFQEMTARLRATATADDGTTVTVRPEIVVEVAYNEIQRSPRYSSGFALRFARIKRIRDDKDTAAVTTLGELQTLYEKQFAAKSRREV